MAGVRIRVICGPTAAGKSGLALDLAARHGATIISADSRQIYRGFDIGTAKAGPAERARVPHRGIDCVEPAERYSAAEWAAQAVAWIDEASAAGRAPLVVGGTGFYLRALFTPLFAAPPLDAARRDALAGALATLDAATLRRWCMTLDPARAHLGRAQLLRAVEVALLTGRRLSEWHRTSARTTTLSPRYLVVDPGPALAGRIERRVDEMFAAGWEDEVRGLTARVPDDAPAWKSSGYVTVRDLVRGRITRRRAVEQAVIETRQYAKRQRTWFRRQLAQDEVVRVDPADARFGERVEHWWNEE